VRHQLPPLFGVLGDCALLITLSPSRMDIWSMDRLELNPRKIIFFCRKSFKSWIGYSKSIWSVHFIALYILCWHTIMCRKFVCTFPCAHIGVQLIFAFNCHIFERVTNLLVNVRADQVLCIRRLSSHCQSNLSHVRIHSVVSCVSLCLFPRWSEQSRTKKSCW